MALEGNVLDVSSVYRAAAESLASEHASRLASMQAAERSIEEHLEAQKAEFRRRRQETITEELIDIVTGFEAAR
jgi:F-type H+-transporting ATPase subunit gamma